MPAYVCTVDSYNDDDLLRAVPTGPILIHGGGNFGDIWPRNQSLREHILAKFKGRLVIQLPQTIKFNDETSIARCADLIKAHKHFHLMVRDQQSLAFAQQHFECPTELVPDSAFALGAKKRPFQPVNDLFILLRTDVERATCDYSSFALVSGISGDWLDEPSNYYSYTKAKSALKAIIKGAWNKDRRRVIFYQQLATGRVERGLRLLSSGNRVITDRLHGHILSTLLDIPHIAMDNNYGKVSGYINAWSKSYPNVQVAATPEEAMEKLELLPS
jgi:exopolysaccharide biosynthesis predicted pyruvyltransferase EpsI